MKLPTSFRTYEAFVHLFKLDLAFLTRTSFPNAFSTLLLPFRCFLEEFIFFTPLNL